MRAYDPHALARSRARENRRAKQERPDRTAWSGNRIPRGYELAWVRGRAQIVSSYPPVPTDAEVAAHIRALFGGA